MENFNLVATAVIIGIVNGVKLIPQNNFQVTSFVSFLIALALGVGFGLVGLFGLNIETGIITALVSSGLYTIAKRVGGQ